MFLKSSRDSSISLWQSILLIVRVHIPIKIKQQSFPGVNVFSRQNCLYCFYSGINGSELFFSIMTSNSLLISSSTRIYLSHSYASFGPPSN